MVLRKGYGLTRSAGTGRPLNLAFCSMLRLCSDRVYEVSKIKMSQRYCLASHTQIQKLHQNKRHAQLTIPAGPQIVGNRGLDL